MSPLREIWFVMLRELRKSFRSVKGILLLLFTVIGGGGLAHLMAQSQEVRNKRFAEKDISPEAVLEVKKRFLGWWFTDGPTGDHVASAPAVMTALFAISLWLIPTVVLLLGFDSVASDLQHRTVRYWTVRTRRWTFITGKFAGLWTTCSAVGLAMHVLIWIICVVRGEASFGQIVFWGFRFWLASLPIIAVWCALSVFVSSLFRMPILALLLTGGLSFLWWIPYFASWISVHFANGADNLEAGVIPQASPILYTFPNFYDRYLLSPNIGGLLTGLAICLGFAAACLAGCSAIFAKRDV